MNVKGKKILIIGTGKSGLAAARLLLAVKAVPVLFDGNEKTDPEEVRKKLPEEAEVKILVGELPQEELEEISLAVFSPGVPVDTPFADRIREQGIPIWGEVELGYAFLKGRLIARARDPLKDVAVRLKNAYHELEEGLKFDYAIENGEREAAARDLLRVIRAEDPEEFALARQRGKIEALLNGYEEVETIC